MLQKHPAEAEVLLRLGAIANALMTIGRAIPASPFKTSKDRQDAFQFFVMVASYIYVAIKELERRHDGLWWQLAESGEKHRALPMPLADLRSLLTKDCEFARSCARIRDKYAFHVDRKPFEALIASATEPVVVFQIEGPAVEDITFPGSYRALIDAVHELGTDDFKDTLTDVMRAFPYMVEAIIIGFGLSKGQLEPPTERPPSSPRE